MVTGGYAVYDGYYRLKSTEILVKESSAWIEVGDLPVPIDGLRGVSFNNKIIMTGNNKSVTCTKIQYYLFRRKR